MGLGFWGFGVLKFLNMLRSMLMLQMFKKLDNPRATRHTHSYLDTKVLHIIIRAVCTLFLSKQHMDEQRATTKDISTFR